MDGVVSQDQDALRAQLARARDRLDGLVRDLRAIDVELEGLEAERTPYRLLDEACGALEGLRALGAAGLFWGERAPEGHADEHLRLVRGRAQAFQQRLGEVEARRQAALERIQRQQDDADLLEDDVFEAQQQEERRKQEWLVEREMSVLPARAPIMPWTRGGEDDLRFRKSLGTSLLLTALLLLVIPRIDLPLPELGEEEPIAVPERLARLILESRPLPPPREEKPSPTERPPEEARELAEQAPQRPSRPAEGPGKGSGEGPGTGPGKGILAFRERFSGVAEAETIARLGSRARISAAGVGPSARSERSMVTTQAPGSSGGINLASLSRDVGGGGGSGGDPIAGVQIARATSTIAGGGGGGRPGRSVAGAGATPGRTDEEIQIVFDRHKAALYRLYNRELRRDPTLKGQMILRLRIEPDGSVSLCVLQGTDMDAPQLATQVVDRVRSFDFGAKEGISAVTILYPIDFLPAA
jgi:hypothetical protein